jgi:nitrite reductase/ring-hydroxylating ferredoxin subunit
VSDWVVVLGLEDAVDRKPVRVTVGEDSVLLLRIDEDLFAIGNTCTHQGAALDRGVVKVAGSIRTVTCPAHGSTFRFDDGKVLRPPATRPVPVYDVRVEDGRILLRSRPDR